MIVAVKTNNKKKVLIKFASFLVVGFMLIAYYFHMSEEFAKKQKMEEDQKIKTIKKNEKIEKRKKLERIIYREIETAVDLIGQRYIQDVKIIKNKALIVVDPKTNLEPLKVRYGAMALIKKNIKDTKIAIDLKYIVESKYDEK